MVRPVSLARQKSSWGMVVKSLCYTTLCAGLSAGLTLWGGDIAQAANNVMDVPGLGNLLVTASYGAGACAVCFAIEALQNIRLLRAERRNRAFGAGVALPRDENRIA